MISYVYTKYNLIINYNNCERSELPSLFNCRAVYIYIYIIESVDSINRDERGFPLTQYITNGGISSAMNTSMHFKHHYCVLRLISNRMSV